MKLAEAFDLLRRKKHIRQTQVSEKTGVSQSAISNYVNGEPCKNSEIQDKLLEFFRQNGISDEIEFEEKEKVSERDFEYLKKFLDEKFYRLELEISNCKDEIRKLKGGSKRAADDDTDDKAPTGSDPG